MQIPKFNQTLQQLDNISSLKRLDDNTHSQYQSTLNKNSTSWTVKIVDFMQMLKFYQTLQKTNNTFTKKRLKRANEGDELQELWFKMKSFLPTSLKCDTFAEYALKGSNSKDKEKIVDFLKKYREFSSNSLFVINYEKLFNSDIENIEKEKFAYMYVSHYSDTAEIESIIYDLVTKQKKEFFLNKYDSVLSGSLDVLLQEGYRLIDFNPGFYNLLFESFNSNDLGSSNSNNVDLVKNEESFYREHYIAYLSLINSVLDPLRSLKLFTKNRSEAKAIDEKYNSISNTLKKGVQKKILTLKHSDNDNELYYAWVKQEIEYKEFLLWQPNQEINGIVDYWINNLPKIFKRSKDIKKMYDFSEMGESEDVIYRNIGEDEVKFLQKNSQFSQYEDSLEREKWFYRKDASTGSGVDHKHKCNIHLKAGALDLLVGKDDKEKWGRWQDWKEWNEEKRGLAKDYEGTSNSAIVQKEHEHHCFGVHEDALPFFNNMVKSVDVDNKKNFSKGSSSGKTKVEFKPQEFSEGLLDLLLSRINNDESKGRIRGKFKEIFSSFFNNKQEQQDNVKNKDLSKSRSIFEAIEEGDIHIIKTFKEESEINQKNNFDNAPLHLATLFKNLEAVAHLVRNGANVSFNDNNSKRIPLHWATILGYEDIVKALLEKSGESVNVKDIEDSTSLHIAARNNNKKIVRILLEKGANVYARDKMGKALLDYVDNIKILTYTKELFNSIDVENGKLNQGKIKDYIRYGAVVNAKNNYGMTPLHIAVQKGDVNIVCVLLMEHAIYNVPDNDGKTPSDYAKSIEVKDVLNLVEGLFNCIGNLEKMKELFSSTTDMSKKAIVNAKNKCGKTPLELAKTQDIRDFLIGKGAISANFINPRLKFDITPLLFAARYGHTESVVELLKKEDVDINERSDDGDTPLHFAAQYNHEKIVELLVKKAKDKGAYTNSLDNYGRTALHLAAKYGCGNIVKLLITNMNDKDKLIKAKDNYGRTALYLAVEGNHKDIVESLLLGVSDKEDYIKDKDNYGRTALHLAAEGNHKDIVESLLLGVSDKEDYIKDKDNYGRTALHLAAEGNHKDIVESLLLGVSDKEDYIKDKDNYGRAALHLSAQDGNKEIVEALLCKVKDKEARELLTASTERGATALHLAAQNGRKEVIDILLSKAADINAKAEDNWTPLHLAAQNGYKDIVKVLLDKGADVNVKDIDNWTPLHLAAQNGHEDIVKALLNRGAEFDVKDSKGNTPLQLAKQSGHQKIENILTFTQELFTIIKNNKVKKVNELEYCIKNGAIVNARNMDGVTPLYYAAQNGYKDIVEVLLDKGADVNVKDIDNWTPLHLAAQNGHKEVIKALLDNVKDKHSRVKFLSASTNRGATALHLAAQNGHKDIVEVLLDKGADVNAKAEDDWTPLHLATQDGHKEVIEALVTNKAEINAKTNEGKTSLYIAAENGQETIVRVLLDKGVVVNTVDTKVQTPLCVAVENNHKKVVEILSSYYRTNVDFRYQGHTPLQIAIKKGYLDIGVVLLKNNANINYLNNEQKKILLRYVTQKGHLKLIELLIKKGVDCQTVDNDGRTPLHWAAETGNLDVVEYLVGKGADVNAKDEDERTPLHMAAENGHLDLVKYLIDEKGVNFKVPDKDGRTPLHMAAAYGYKEIVDVLLERNANVNDNDQLFDWSPLVYAAQGGSWNIAGSLLVKGAESSDLKKVQNFRSVDKEGVTLLHFAISHTSDIDTIKLIIDKDADVNARDSNVNTPLHLAAQRGYEEIVKDLLKKGAIFDAKNRENNTPLKLADGYEGIKKILTSTQGLFTTIKDDCLSESERINKLEDYIKEGAIVNSKEGGAEGTPLCMAVKERKLELVEYLIKKEADLNSPDKDGKTPLYWAAYSSKWDVVNLLIEKGANVNAKDKDGKTPLYWAICRGNLDVVKLLIRKDADLNSSDKDGKTPLHWAAYEDKLDVVECLINNGADVEAKDKEDSTPLHMAADGGNNLVVDYLIKKGADLNIHDQDGETPLHKAAYRGGYMKVVEVLIKHVETKRPSKLKEFINAKTKDGRTPLNNAAYLDRLDVVRYLVGKGADINMPNKYGETPLHRAAKSGYKEIVQLLLSNNANPNIKDKEGKIPLDLAKDQEIIGLLKPHRQGATHHQEEEILGSMSSSEECLPGPSSRGGASRRKREAKVGECELSWDDVDKFNEEKEEVRDFSKIKINSDRFINYIKSESMSENKLAQLVQLVDKVQVTGKFRGLVNKLISNQKVMNHLNRVGRVSGIAMHGMMGKATLAAFLNDDEKGVAINLGFIAGGQGFAKVAEAASIKGSGLVLDGKILLGRSLKAASPFLARGTSAFVVYDLINQIKEFKNGTEDALVSVVGDGIYLGVDAAEVGIEIAEAFEVFEGVSSITGPIGAAIGAVIFVGTDIYLAVKRVDKINEIIHLTGNERFIEGLRAFIGIQPEQYVEELMEEKEVSNQLVKQGLEYLQQHSDIQRYVFPTGKSVIDSCRDVPYKVSICVSGGLGGNCFKTRTVTRYAEECTTKFQVDLDNKVLLDRKRTDIKWNRAKPDNPNGGELFCLPQGDYEQVPSNGTYLCNNAIGITDSSATKAGNYTFITLGEGDDYVEGFPDSPNIISVDDGFKRLHGGSKDDMFILQGNVIKGNINGGNGTNTLDLGNFAPTQKLVQIYLDQKYVVHGDYGHSHLGISNINKVSARKEKTDRIGCDCNTEYVDGRGGEGSAKDIIVIPSNNSCSYKVQLVIRPYTTVNNQALRGNFSYVVSTGSGEADINLQTLLSESRHNFFFNYALPGIKSINLSSNDISYNITFSFVNNNTSVENTSDRLFNVTTLSNTNNTFYKLNDNTEIKVGRKNLYAVQSSNRSVDEIVNSYPAIADRLKMFLFVQSSLSNETVAIGHGNHDVLHNSPYHKSHLIGNGGENIFVITSGYEVLDDGKLDIPEVVIYDVDKENLIDTLDLHQIKQQVKRDLNKEVKAKVVISNKDLLIELLCFRENQVPKDVVKVRLKDALLTNWYERLHVIVNSVPMRIEEFELKPLPLVFDESDKNIIVIGSQDVEEENRIVVSKEIGNYTFARLGNDLIITNASDRNLTDKELCTIFLSEFYQEPKMQTLSIIFTDKKMSVRDEMSKINNAIRFEDQLNKLKNVSSIIDDYSNHIRYKDSESMNGNVTTNRQERSINLEDQEFFNAQNDAIFTIKAISGGNKLPSITGFHQRKRRDESTVRGYENNNDQALFYGQNNANSSLKRQQVTSGANKLPSSTDSHRRKRRNESTVRDYENNNDRALFYGQNNAKFTIKNNQATSGTNKLSSWINTAFDFAAKGISQLGNFFSSSKVSFPTINVEHPTLSSKQDSTRNNSTNLTPQIDVDGTILLLDVLIRKITGEKYVSSVNHPITFEEAQTNALNITEEFGKVLNSTSKVPAEELIDLAEVQSKIFKAMMSGDGGRIPKILCSSVEEAKLEPEVTKKILAAFQPTKPTASTLGGQIKHLPSLPNTKPQTCLSNIKVENSSVQLCRAV